MNQIILLDGDTPLQLIRKNKNIWKKIFGELSDHLK